MLLLGSAIIKKSGAFILSRYCYRDSKPKAKRDVYHTAVVAFTEMGGAVQVRLLPLPFGGGHVAPPVYKGSEGRTSTDSGFGVGSGVIQVI